MVRTFIITLIDCCFFDERGMVGKEPFDTRPHAQKMQKFIPNLMKIGQNSSGNDFQPHRRRVDLIGEGKRRRSPMGLEVVAIQEWEHMRSHDDVLWPIRMRYSKGSHRRTRLPETLTTPIVLVWFGGISRRTDTASCGGHVGSVKADGQNVAIDKVGRICHLSLFFGGLAFLEITTAKNGPSLFVLVLLIPRTEATVMSVILVMTITK